jgi:hypothetical protein
VGRGVGVEDEREGGAEMGWWESEECDALDGLPMSEVQRDAIREYCEVLAVVDPEGYGPTLVVAPMGAGEDGPGFDACMVDDCDVPTFMRPELPGDDLGDSPIEGEVRDDTFVAVLVDEDGRAFRRRRIAWPCGDIEGLYRDHPAFRRTRS